jgi:filamin
MCNPKVDEMSVMTYVSYFPEAKCKPGAPHRPQLPPSAKCSAEGPGITAEGLVAKQSAPFTVFTAGAGKGSPQVNVFGPDRMNVTCEVVDNGDKTFSCNYAPPQQGKFSLYTHSTDGMFP